MKRWIHAATNSYSFIDILNDPRGRELIETIENADDEIRGRGIDPNDESEFYVRDRLRAIEALKKEFGFDYK